MRCPDNREWELYLDGELPSARRDELQAHLSACGVCAARLHALRREDALLGAALAALPEPADLAARIERRLNMAETWHAGWLWLLLPAVGLAGALAAFLAGWGPVAQRVWSFLDLLGGGELLFWLLLAAGAALRTLAAGIVRGEAFLPALVILVLCVVWLQAQLRKGGFARV